MQTLDYLYKIAKDKYSCNAPIQSICTAIDEAKGHQTVQLALIESSIDQCKKINPYQFWFAETNMHRYTYDLDIAVGKLKTLFFTLACALEGLGEQIEY